MKVKKPSAPLPKGILLSDLAWDKDEYSIEQLTMYRTERFGWVITTLHISNGKRGQPSRSYGIAVKDGGIVTVGNGPHVLDEVRVYVRKSRLGDLQQYLDLHQKGMGNAGEIRDRISTKRARTAQRRSSWGMY